jgi:hypothetical protein
MMEQTDPLVKEVQETILPILENIKKKLENFGTLNIF